MKHMWSAIEVMRFQANVHMISVQIRCNEEDYIYYFK